MLIAAAMPWRADWLTSGLYDDGWMLPGKAARIRVFAMPGQRGAVTRTLSVQVQLPPNVSGQRFELVSNLATVRAEATTSATANETIAVCVPAHGFAAVRLTTPTISPIPGDQRSQYASTLPRTGGLLVADISLADELGGPCTAQRRVFERGRRVAGVGRVEVRPGRHDLVDLVEQRVVELDVGRADLALELLHRPRPDDRRGDAGMPEHERDRQVDQRDPGLVGERGERVGRVELRAGSRAATCRSARAAARCACSRAAPGPCGSGR